jgi:hypothetical protein
MIARITSPIAGPSCTHRPRRKTFRVVARGVVFIQRIKYVSSSFSSCSIPHLWMTGEQARSGAPNVRPNQPSKLRSKMCGVEGSSREDRYSKSPIRTPYIATVELSAAFLYCSTISYYYYLSLSKDSCCIYAHSTAPDVCITGFYVICQVQATAPLLGLLCSQAQSL